MSNITDYSLFEVFFQQLQVAATEPFSEQAEVTVKTNFWGTLDVCKSLFPLLRPHARQVLFLFFILFIDAL